MDAAGHAGARGDPAASFFRFFDLAFFYGRDFLPNTLREVLTPQKKGFSGFGRIPPADPQVGINPFKQEFRYFLRILFDSISFPY